MGSACHPFPYHAVYVLTEFGSRGAILIAFGPAAVALSAWRRTHPIQPLVRFLVPLAPLTGVVYAFKFGVGRTAPIVDHLHAGAESHPSGHVPNAILMGA